MSGLRGVASGVRELLDLEFIEFKVRPTADKEVAVSEGVPDWESSVELPIVRGKIHLGTLRASSFGGEEPDGERFAGLRAVTSFCALIAEVIRSRDLAATRAAHGSAVQIASEALGNILDEEQLYKTVLVLTLELLDASGGVILLDERTVSIGDGEGVLEDLREVSREGRGPWMGQVRDRCFLGTPIGRAESAIFLVRKTRPYSDSEGGSLKLVARQLARARERSQLYAAMERSTQEAIRALSAALESRDGTTGNHIQRAQRLAGEVAEELELDPEDVQRTRYVAVLHDVGKIGIPDAVLNKPGKLDEAEWELMRRHPRIGADIVSRIYGFEKVAAAVLAHHERIDGLGYPAGLSGEEIPIEARIISAVDSYDAMTNDRPYRRAMSHEEAFDELYRGAGSQFDRKVVEALNKVLSVRTGEEQ